VPREWESFTEAREFARSLGLKSRAEWLRYCACIVRAFKVAVNVAAQTYGITPSAAALRVINLISDYDKKVTWSMNCVS